MKTLILSAIVMLGLSACSTVPKHTDIEEGWKAMDGILEQIQAPVFPDKQFVITDFGAKTDGSLCTDAIRQAIVACNEAGGGRVLVPKGTYLTGAIHLLSNVELHVEEGATLLFSTNPADYLPVVQSRFEGSEMMNYSPLIYAWKQENIAVTGKGTLDGQASIENWWLWVWQSKENVAKGLPSQNNPNSVPRLLDLMGKGVPTAERVFGEGHYLRPSFFQPYYCKNILIEGVTLINPPMWMLHPVLSENITVRGVKLFSQGAPNGDGCDPECCKNVLIEDCEFNTGDDCIAIKSGRNRQGYEMGIPTENVIIRNCKMLDGHGGVVLGSETSGGVRNVYAYNCEMSSPHLERAIRLKSNKYRGGVIENVYVRDIKVGEVNNAAIRINQNYFSIVAPKEIRYTTYRNIFIENLTCEKAEYAVQIMGLEELPIENVKIINCSFNNIEKENVLESVEGLVLENVTINGEPSVVE
ncbi:glycoside hydrolase family 28 protein [Prolixibacteraceae bacterium Z1-6]|uniref:Glycoside hydrolase family 28 protein n=1 Tax=Draconibacterium aestuarii TaxID=2998507 RepID=A0A9X3FFV0_9BACT|nr:glycoside hydrolase family 28 protein [Prolixibacteraceae bacterium Z1-6]